VGLQGRRSDRDLAGDRGRRGLHRQPERPPVRDRPADRPGEVELQVQPADRVLACSGRRHPYFVSSRARWPRSTWRPASRNGCTPSSNERKFEAQGLHGYAPAKQTIRMHGTSLPPHPPSPTARCTSAARRERLRVDAMSGVLQWKFATAMSCTPRRRWPATRSMSAAGQPSLRDRCRERPAEMAFQGGEDRSIHNQVGFQSSPAVVTARCTSQPGRARVRPRRRHRPQEVGLPTSKSWVNATPAVRDGLVYVGTSTARASWRSTRAPAPAIQLHAKSYIFSSAALAGDLAYFGSHNGKLYAVNARPVSSRAIPDRGVTARCDEAAESRRQPERASFAPVFGDFRHVRRLLPVRVPGRDHGSPAWTAACFTSAAWTATCTPCAKPPHDGASNPRPHDLRRGAQ